MYDTRNPPKYNNTKNDVILNVCLFLNNLFQKFQRYWQSGYKLNIDDKTLGLQVKYQRKLHITYNKVGDEFQCD